MAIVVQSFESRTGSNPSFTKPTGLAVGDVLIAMLCTPDTSIPTSPAGWTLLTNSSTGGAPFDPLTVIYYKVADSSDVSAPTFNFTSPPTFTVSVLMHVTGGAPTVNFSDSESLFFNPSGGTGRIDVSFNFNLTPAANGELFVGAIAGNNTSGPAEGFYTNFRLNDGTSIIEMFERSNSTFSATFFYGIQTTNTPLTSLIVDVDIDNGGTTEYASSFGTLTPIINVTGNMVLATATPSFFGQDNVVGINVAQALGSQSAPTFFDSIATVIQPQVWINQTKPSTSWTNQPKP